MPSHVMILGCGRSGTSIFGELFEGLDTYAYRSEPPFGEVLGADFSIPRAYKVPRESSDHPAPAGISFPLQAFLSCAPGAAIFWIVRHPLDAVCSLRVGVENDWGHHPRPPDWTEWLDRPVLERCARHWSFLNTAGFDHVADHAEVVRFEDMIADPLTFARRVCATVGVNADTCAEHIGGWAGRVQDANNAAFVEAMTSRRYSRPDHSARVGRWRENLSRSEAEAIWPLVATAAERFCYSLDPELS